MPDRDICRKPHARVGAHSDTSPECLCKRQPKLAPTRACEQELFLPRPSLSVESAPQGTRPRPRLGECMSPIPRPVECNHPRLVKLVKFKGEHVIHCRCELCGAIITTPEQREHEWEQAPLLSPDSFTHTPQAANH